MIVAITGGRGFIGKRLVERCIQRGDQVRVLSRKTQAARECVQYFEGNLIEQDVDLSGFLKNIDVLYHCAGEIHDQEVMKKLHIDGTQRLINAIAAEAVRTKKEIHWIQLSSVGAYGAPLGRASASRVVTENTELHPRGVYEETKLKSDQLVVECSHNNYAYTIVRPSIVFGNDMPNQSLKNLVSMVKKGMFFYIGKNDAVAPYVHVDDVAELLIRCAELNSAKSEIFNISNDCYFKDLVNAIADFSSVKRPFIRIPEILARFLVSITSRIVELPLTQNRIDTLVSRTRYSTAKLENKLGFYPQKNPIKYIQEIIKT